MKLFGRIIFGFFIVLIGFNLFSCSQSSAYNQAIKEGVDQAYLDKDYANVNKMYEYAYDEPYINKQTVTIVDGDNRFDVENRDITFDLYVFLQLRVDKGFLSSGRNVPVFTILLTDLTLENKSQILDIVIYKHNIVEDKEERTIIEHQLVNAGEQNWYIQTFEFDTTNISKILITHQGVSSKEPIVLYNSTDDKEIFLKAEDHNIFNVVDKNLSLAENNIIKSETDLFKIRWLMTIVTMLVYLGAVGLVTYAMFFKKQKTGPIVQQQVNPQNQQPKKTVVDTPKENINVKNIEETKHRDNLENKKDKE